MDNVEQLRAIKELLARIDSGTNVDAGGFRRNPTSVYVDEQLATREWAEFFASHPQMIGLSGDLPAPGSFVTIDDLGMPILATRDQDGVFRAMLNVCRHRGAIVESEVSGTRRRFTCPFHNWSYDTSGALVGIPKPDHFGEIDRSCNGLVQLPAVERDGLLWLHPDPNGTIDIDQLITPELAGELQSWNFADMSILDRDSYDIECNWKLAMDTFGETYHFQALHSDTLGLFFRGNVQCYDTYGRNHRMLLCRRAIDEMRTWPEDQWDITIAALPVYWLFPNIQLMPTMTGCYLVRAYPVPGEPGRHISRISFYLRPGATDDSDTDGGIDTELERDVAKGFAQIIRDEDYVMSASQQRSASTGALTHSLFGRNEPALHHYHNTYRAALGMELLPLLDETMLDRA